MTWQIELSQIAEDFLDNLYKSDKRAVIQINKKFHTFVQSPRQFGKPLKGDKVGIWRYRVGDYRILCQLRDDELIILVLAIGSRKDLYSG